MTDTPAKPTEQQWVVKKKQPSPFSADPFNKRGGKGGKKGAVMSGGQKMKPTTIVPIVVPKFKGGSGGDR